MFWYWETVDWTTTTVTRTLNTGTVGVTQRHCSDLKLAAQIFIGKMKLDTTVDTWMKDEGDLTPHFVGELILLL